MDPDSFVEYFSKLLKSEKANDDGLEEFLQSLAPTEREICTLAIAFAKENSNAKVEEILNIFEINIATIQHDNQYLIAVMTELVERLINTGKNALAKEVAQKLLINCKTENIRIYAGLLKLLWNEDENLAMAWYSVSLLCIKEIIKNKTDEEMKGDYVGILHYFDMLLWFTKTQENELRILCDGYTLLQKHFSVIESVKYLYWIGEKYSEMGNIEKAKEFCTLMTEKANLILESSIELDIHSVSNLLCIFALQIKLEYKTECDELVDIFTKAILTLGDDDDDKISSYYNIMIEYCAQFKNFKKVEEILNLMEVKGKSIASITEILYLLSQDMDDEPILDDMHCTLLKIQKIVELNNNTLQNMLFKGMRAQILYKLGKKEEAELDYKYVIDHCRGNVHDFPPLNKQETSVFIGVISSTTHYLNSNGRLMEFEKIVIDFLIPLSKHVKKLEAWAYIIHTMLANNKIEKALNYTLKYEALLLETTLQEEDEMQKIMDCSLEMAQVFIAKGVKELASKVLKVTVSKLKGFAAEELLQDAILLLELTGLGF